MNTVFKYL
jgi:hypothetical protein